MPQTEMSQTTGWEMNFGQLHQFRSMEQTYRHTKLKLTELTLTELTLIELTLIELTLIELNLIF